MAVARLAPVAGETQQHGPPKKAAQTRLPWFPVWSEPKRHPSRALACVGTVFHVVAWNFEW